jgi:lauroyl/myristoyl acyltransferase
MRSYLRYWMEALRLPAMSHDRIRSGMRITGIEKVFSMVAAGRGVVLTLPPERLRPESLFDRFVAYRESLGMEVLAHAGDGNGVFGRLARRLREARIVCLVADRDLSASGVEVDFFGRPARMPGGPAALAAQTGAALMPAYLWYEGDRWAAHVHEEIPVPGEGDRRQKVRVMTQELARAFEVGIAAHPQDWHMLQRVWVEDLGEK